MKKIILCLFVLCNLVVQAQWKQSLTGQTSLVRDVSVVSNDIIWAKDQIGTSVSISLDGGNYWVTKNLPTEMINGGIGGFSAVSATTAYIIVCENAQKGVYKTTNSGDSWVKQTTAFNADSPFPDFVYFWNENDGVAVGDGYATTNQSLEIYTTNNGGTQWNRVTASNIPSAIYDWAYNGNISFKVHGNTIFFETGLGKIFKSVNKGLSWVIINTPIATNQNFSFDFKDDLHGLISYYNASALSYNLYSTSDGGVNWTSINPTNCYSELYYNQLNGVYYSTHSNYGLSYSKDNGNTWTLHPSFKNVGVSAIEISSTGKIFMGGWRYMYQTENYEGVNIWVKEAKITGVNTMDITYSENPDPATSQNMTNYAIGYLDNKVLKSLNIQSLIQDATNQSIMHVTMQSDLPLDTIKVNIGGVKDNTGINGYSVINRSLTLYNFNPSKTLQVNTAGTLASLLTANELATITNLTLTGTIDARDFVTLRDAMPVLAALDISGVTIAAYDGTAGPANVKANMTPAISEPEKTELDNDPLLSIIAQHIKMQTKTATTTTYPANEIPQYAFYNPTTGSRKVSLKSIVLPNSTTSIGSDAFDFCTGLNSITLPASVTSIGSWAFYNCIGLTSITIPASVISIGSYAFSYCTGLTSIAVPASVISIGEQAFLRCGLINVDNRNPNYSSQEGVLYNKLKTQIIQCPTVKTGSFSILNSVISIGISAFESCTGLTSIALPSSVSSIGNFAFYYCSGLSSITIPASVTSIGDQAFYKCGLINVDNGNPNYSSQEGVLYNKLKTQIIQCPTVKTGSFSIPNSVTLIGDYAFFYCNGLTSITIPASVSSIGERTFYRCTGLTSITIPASVTTIGSSAFYYCTGLTSIYANPVTPIDLTNKYSVFYNINKNTCTLYVPQGSKAVYQVAIQWKDFTNIVEFTPAATETLLTNLEYPQGLCLNGDKIYLTETAARNTSYGGKLCLDKYNILTKQKTILKNNPICSDALVATNDNKLYLSSYVSSIPGQSGKISVYDLTSNIESLFLNIEIATEDMYLNTNGDMLIIGSSDLVDAKSIYKLAFGNYNSPIILKTGLGRVTSITESNNRIYFSSYMNIKYFDSDGIVQTLLNNHGAYSISCSQDYLYYADGVKNTIGRVHLSTMVDEVLLTNLNSPIAVRYDNSTNKLYFLESGTNSGLYKDGTLKVITITPTGIKNVTVNSISISPNPARSYLKVTTSEIINRIVVYDISGRIVQNIIVGTNSYKLNVSGLLNGIYLIKGFTDKGFVMGKFIKE